MEQVAYRVSNVVPGIGFSNDPLLQGRILSYVDTQLSRGQSELSTNSYQCAEMSFRKHAA